MRLGLVWLVFFVFSCTARAQAPLVLLRPLDSDPAPGAQRSVEWVVLNPTGAPLEYEFAPSLRARLLAGDRSWTVELRREDARNSSTLPAGGFDRRSYSFALPADARGQGVLQIEGVLDVRTVLDLPSAGPAEGGAVAGAAPEPNPVSPSGAARGGLVPRAAASRIERTFREHFEPYEPVYFIFGPGHPAAKFQLSFKYRVLGDATADAPETTRNSLQFGYSQRSIWDITADSSPFVDTSYMPEVFYEHLAPESPSDWRVPFNWLGYQIGYGHESNGKDGFSSRSYNTVFLRPSIALGELGGWRVIFAPRLFAYILDMSDNPDMKHYRGYGEARLVFGRNDGPELSASARIGSGWDHFTYQLDFTYPLRFTSGDFASYLLVQYFNGYSESLIRYTERTEVIRAGFSFVR